MQSELIEPVVSPDSPVLAVELPEEFVVKSSLTRVSRRGFTTHIREPEDDAPRRYGCTHTKQTRRVEQGSLVVLIEAQVFEFVRIPPILHGRMDQGVIHRVDQDFEDGTEICRALLPEGQSDSDPGEPIRNSVMNLSGIASVSFRSGNSSLSCGLSLDPSGHLEHDYSH